MRLPRQSHLPTVDQLRQLYSDAIRNPGRTCELPFGENFLLSVSRPRGTGGCDWTLYRWVGSTSTPEWVYDSNDPRWVAQQIVEYFPRWSPHRRPAQDPEAVQNSSWFSMTSAMDAENEQQQPQQGARPAMEGDIKHVGMPNLLRSLAKDKLTGRLEVWSNGKNGLIYILSGAPVHAAMGEDQGEIVVLEVINWNDGRFQFHFDTSNNRHTIHKRLDLLLLDAAHHKEKMRFAEQTPERMVPGYNNFARRQEEELNEEDTFARAAMSVSQTNRAPSPPVNSAVNVPAPTTPSDAQTRIQARVQAEVAAVTPAAFTVNSPTDVQRILTNPSTGLYTYPALLYFLDMEFVRCQRYNRCFSMLLLDVGVKSNDDTKTLLPLGEAADVELANLIKSVKRGPDLLAHYKKPGSFAMLLPETDPNLGRNLTFRLAEFLRNIPPNEWTGGQQLGFAIGMAGAPQDSQTCEGLLEVAAASKLTFGV